MNLPTPSQATDHHEHAVLVMVAPGGAVRRYSHRIVIATNHRMWSCW
jgi:hypothetical protein